MLATTLLTVSGLASLSTAGYVLQDDYTSQNFFSKFDFFTAGDPTHGYVNYVDQSTASSSNLINTNNGAVYMGVDSTNVATGSGRNSIRVTSKASYNHGLVILDLAHMPGSVCGSWPAFWMVGPNWPTSGEIDIIEGVNSQDGNAMTLHTNAGCSVSNTGDFTGQLKTANCDVNAAGQAANTGCGIATSQTSSYGDGFNAAQGGVYATEWTSEKISIWYFSRASIPADITAGIPNPAGWGMATAAFSGSCNIDDHFQNLQIVFDTTFCGDWAGNVWSTDATCSAKASTCQGFVQNNPSAFKESYWSINSLKVYSGSSNAPAVKTTQSHSIPVPTASQGIPTSAPWPAGTGISSAVPTTATASWPVGTGISGVVSMPASTASGASAQPQSAGQTWSWGQGHGGNSKTYSAVDGGQFYQATTASEPASTAPAAISLEATPAAPPAAPTPEGTSGRQSGSGPVDVAYDPNTGMVGEYSEPLSARTAIPTAVTTTMNLGHAAVDDKDSNKDYVTVSALSFDDSPKEKRQEGEVEEEQLEKRHSHVHRHMIEHKRRWSRKGAWKR